MPRPARPWFRFYSETLESLKVHELPDRLVKPWLFMLCLANMNTPRGRLPSVSKVAFALRVKEDKAKAIIAALVDHRFIDYDGKHYVMHEWDEFQRERDLSPSYRDEESRINHANVTETVSENHDNPSRARTRVEESRLDLEKDQEEEKEQEAPPSHPFALAYAEHYRRQHSGNPPPQTQHAAAIALEREHGADWCFQAAESFDWQKPPAYLRPWIVDHKEKADAGRNRNGIHTAEPVVTTVNWGVRYEPAPRVELTEEERQRVLDDLARAEAEADAVVQARGKAASASGQSS